jgi:hypothetical protein
MKKNPLAVEVAEVEVGAEAEVELQYLLLVQ